MSTSIRGTSVSPGLAAGRVYIADLGVAEVGNWTVRVEAVTEEIGKLHQAIKEAVEQLQETRERVCRQVGEENARIFDFQSYVIQDPDSLGKMEDSIRAQHLTAEAAVVRFTEIILKRFEELASSGPGVDIQDAFQRVRNCLRQIERRGLEATPEGVVLVAHTLTPSLTMMFAREDILAIVTESGGRFSHGAILARSMGIPTVIGAKGVASEVNAGEQVLVDGGEGTVELRPDPERQKEFLAAKRRYDELQRAVQRYAKKRAVTLDGQRIQLHVNIGSIQELSTFEPQICDGVGLCRTEFLYQARSEFPSEDEQFQIYRSIVEAMQGRSVVFRTLDIGNDKQLPYFGMPKEANPALGWRGLRISLHWQDLFLVQLRALLRTSAFGKVRILLPMVTTPDEVLQVRALLDDLEEDLRREGIAFDEEVPLGVMIEVPAAIYGLPLYADAIDFLSIGTNDLVQYLLAVDRDNPWVASLCDPYHPVVLRAIAEILRTAAKYGLPVSVCGEMAGMADTALVLIALGLRDLSMAPKWIPHVKLIVSQVRTEDLEGLKHAVLTKTSPADVRSFLEALVEGVRFAALAEFG